MSIRIGTNSTNERYMGMTTAERLVMYSAVESNMVRLTSSLSNTNILCDQFVFGRSNESFHVSHFNAPLLFADSNVGIHVPVNMTVDGVLFLQSNVTVARTFAASNVVATNVSLTGQGSSEIFRITASNQSNVMYIPSSGVITATSPMCIGTTAPASATTLLTVASNIAALGVTAGTVSTVRVIDSRTYDNPLNMEFNLPQRRIDLNGDVRVAGDMQINGNTSFAANVSFVNLTARNSLVASNLVNIIGFQTLSRPLIDMVYTGNLDTGCNLMSVKLRPSDSNVSAFVLDTYGRIGMGTTAANAFIDMVVDANHTASNYIRVQNVTTSNADFVMDSNANVGIGTTVSLNKLCVSYKENDTYSLSSNALVQLSYGSTATAGSCNAPLLVATSNEEECLRISNNGSVKIGFIPWDATSTYALDVTPNSTSRLPSVEMHQLAGNPTASGKIMAPSVQICGLSNVTTSNASIDRLSCCNMYADYVYTRDYENLGMSCIHGTVNTFQVKVERFHHVGSNILFAASTNDAPSDPTTQGKLKIICDPPRTGTVSRGISVEAAGTTSMIVESRTADAFYELAAQKSVDVKRGRVGILADGTICMGHDAAGSVPSDFTASTTPKFCIYLTGTNPAYTAGASIGLMKRTFVTEGGVYVNTISVDASKNFTVNGNALFNTSATPAQPVLAVSSDTTFRRVGVCTSDPQFSLDVNGTVCLRDNSRFLSNVGVGTAPSTGDVVQMTNIASPTRNVLTINNRGSGHGLYVIGTTSNFVVDSAGNVGMGIGMVAPRYTIDIKGDVNFSGRLLQNGALYGQTFSNVLNTNDVYINANVGIGTTTPLYGLHVAGGRQIYCTSNISSDGTMYARGNFMTTSDRNVKVDLYPITDALAKVCRLSGYTYTRTDTHMREAGLIAQDVAQVLPEVVHRNDGSGLLTISYGNLASMFVEAFKEIRRELDEIKRAHTS